MEGMPIRRNPDQGRGQVTMNARKGPLVGVRIIEKTGFGPVPYAAMLLADLGAQIIRIDRPGGYPAPDPSLDFAAMGATAVTKHQRFNLLMKHAV